MLCERCNSRVFFMVHSVCDAIIFQRYQVNDFKENEDENEENEATDTYYVRPFIPFWS